MVWVTLSSLTSSYWITSMVLNLRPMGQIYPMEPCHLAQGLPRGSKIWGQGRDDSVNCHSSTAKFPDPWGAHRLDNMTWCTRSYQCIVGPAQAVGPVHGQIRHMASSQCRARPGIWGTGLHPQTNRPSPLYRIKPYHSSSPWGCNG